MESQSAPEQRSNDFMPLDPGRPAGLEFAMGVALFAIILVVFLLVQGYALVHGVIALTPDLQQSAFSLALFEDPLFKQRLTDLAYHGDLVGMESAWSAGICTALIFLLAWRWKRDKTGLLLGLRLPNPKQMLIWVAVFAATAALIEMLAAFIPAFRTDFMQKVVASTTNWPVLVLGVVLLGPLFEELLLRGLLFGSLRHIVDEHASIAITAGVFAVMHLQYSPAIMLLILIMGIVLGYARARSGSIWVPVLLHMVNNGMSVLWP
ncbi:MAG: CPBP family intramembrane metalloprotease [Flavobacteriales bacterium]|nr:CPBP family intramembrane metalloprotease [Flavobacteriales bacterium]